MLQEKNHAGTFHGYEDLLCLERLRPTRGMKYIFFTLLLSIPAGAFASPVINEILWMGSDVSTTDEWIELYNPDETAVDLSGWSLSTLSSKGQEVIAISFETGSVLEAGEYWVIARKSAASSALEEEPTFLAPSLSLLNTSLLVRLRTAEGILIDEVDDGSGSPFAGSNPSGTGAKASMERVSPFASGSEKSNWRSASSALGIKLSSTTLATPGYENSAPAYEPKEGCTDDLSIAIAVQSGPLVGVGKVSVNFQAVALTGSLPSSACSWQYGDGFVSTSCNPPSHSFLTQGTYIVHLEVRNSCGEILTQDQQVDVLPDPKSISGTAYYDGSKLVLRAALPNPEGADTGKEWIEIFNPEKHVVNLVGWRLKIGTASTKSYALSGEISSMGSLRIYGTEGGFTLPNNATEICIAPPTGECLSKVEWKSAEQDREYYSIDLREITVRGQLLRAIGSTVLEVQLDPSAAAILGESLVYVKLLGITPVTMSDAREISERMNYIEALIENKKVELEFDTEMWDELGRLQAYVYTDQQLSLQEQCLVSGFWMLDRQVDFSKKELFSFSEKKELVAKLYRETEIVDEVLQDENPQSGLITHDPRWDGVRISEIFASPSPQFTEGYLSKEWLEIESKSTDPLSLSGFVLQAGAKKISLGEGLNVMSGHLLTLDLQERKLPLKNDGTTVALFSPDGILISSVEYPKLAYGITYARVGDRYCLTTAPTPMGPNVCAGTQASLTKSVKKPRASVSPAVKGYASFYAAQLSGSSQNITVEDEGSQQSIFLLLLSFALGVGFGVLPMVFRFQRQDKL